MSHPIASRRARLLTVAALATIAASGCASWREAAPKKLSDAAKLIDVPSGIPWDKERRTTGVPTRVVASWTDAVRRSPGEPAERGFGGRLYFYDRDPKKPVAVDGTLVVYAFDETDRLPTDNKPTRRYVFPAETFKLHESKSEFGVSYSVWLPWDEAGGPQTDVSLIARFDPANGSTMAVSDQARERLPGTLGPNFTRELIASREKGENPLGKDRPKMPSLAQASYEAPSTGDARVSTRSGASVGGFSGAGNAGGVETTTISVPSGSRVANSLSRTPVQRGASVTYQSRGESVRASRGLSPRQTQRGSRPAQGASSVPPPAVR